MLYTNDTCIVLQISSLPYRNYVSQAEAKKKSDDDEVNVRMGAGVKCVLWQLYGKDDIKKQGLRGNTSKSLEHKRRISMLYSKYYNIAINIHH